jgi:hypothetical protein
LPLALGPVCFFAIGFFNSSIRDERKYFLSIYHALYIMAFLRCPGNDSATWILGIPVAEFGVGSHSVANDSLINTNTHDLLTGRNSILMARMAYFVCVI